MKQYIRLITFAMIAMMGMSLASCSNDDDDNKVEYKDISLTCKEEYKITGSGDEIWTSSNKNIASVSEDNVVTAKLVGEAMISSSKGSFKVNVSSKNNAFNDPFLEWGAPKSKVKSFHGNSTPIKDTNKDLVYQYAGGNALTMYMFESGALSSAGVGLTSSYTSSDRLIDHLTDRYIPVQTDKDNYSFYFVSPDEKTMLMLKLETSGTKVLYVIVYAPINNNRTRAGMPLHNRLTSAMECFYNCGPSDAVAGEFNRISSMLKR